MHTKITILGCGLSGMITALAFAKHNTPSVIIEKQSSKSKNFFKDVRTTAITASSKEFFQSINIWDKVYEISSILNDIYVVDNKAPEILHFASKELEGQEKMGYLVENNEFKKVLLQLVQNNKLITLLENTSYEVRSNSIERCSLILNQQSKMECDLLIVCDGRYSSARQKYFSSETEKLYKQHAITFITHHEKPHEGTAVEHFMPSGPFAILPLKDQNLSSIVWTVSSEKKDTIMNLPHDELVYLVQENFGDFLGKITIRSEVAAFPLKFYETKQYYNKRIVLVADTAHIMHPLAGQGLNQGIKDIQHLTELVSEYGIGEHSLSIYQKQRKIDNNNMLEITDMLNSVFSNQSKLLHISRQFGFKLIENIPFLKKTLIKYAMGKR